MTRSRQTFPPAIRSRSAGRTVVFFCLLFIAGGMAGCGSRIQKIYDGPERPPAETATVYNSPRAFTSTIVSIISIDDRRVESTATGYAVTPGPHWFQVWVDRLSPSSFLFLHDIYHTEAVCGFRLDAAPSAKYRPVEIDNGAAVSTRRHNIHKAALTLRQQTASGDTAEHTIPAECAPIDSFDDNAFGLPHDRTRGGLLCRRTDDCLQAGAVCKIDDGYDFGVCSPN